MDQEQFPIEEIPLADIQLDRDTQVRVTISEETVERYFEVMTDEAARDRFPAILLFRDEDGKLWLADGHHRVMAAIRRKFKSILAVIRPGTKADAIWAAIKANGKNGLPLGKADMKRAIEMALSACPDRSNRVIADAVGCNEKTIRKYRSDISPSNVSTADKSAVETRIGKDGKSRPAKMPKPETVAATASVPQEIKKEVTPVTMPLPSKMEEPESMDRSDDRSRIEANIKETQILGTISQLQTQIAEWFENAPKDMFEGFGKRLRKRIGELID